MGVLAGRRPKPRPATPELDPLRAEIATEVIRDLFGVIVDDQAPRIMTLSETLRALASAVEGEQRA